MEIKHWTVINDAQSWYDTYFARQARDDHQAKGFPNLYMQVMKYLLDSGITPDKHVILDPMCGIGTTLILANLHGFDSIGIELEEIYYKDMIGFGGKLEFGDDSLFGEHTSDIHIDGNIERFLRVTGRHNEIFTEKNYTAYWNDRRPIIQIFNTNSVRDDMPDIVRANAKWSGYPVVVTSPPYMRTSEHNEQQVASMTKSLANNPNPKNHGIRAMTYQNKSNIAFLEDTYTYQQCLKKLYGNCIKLGTELFVIVTRDFITDGHVVMLWKFNQNAMELNGFELVDHIQAKLPFKSLFRIIQQKRHDKKGLPDIDYEDVCVYRKKEKQ
jgi:hypothetical protein